MKILAVDCCLRLTGAALMLDDKFDFEQEDLGRLQSSELPKMTERLLRKNNLSWQELDYVALTNGPGYFTGIRVGAAYASGLAYACGVKIIPVSSLELLAYGSHEKVLVVVYAGHGFVYAECKNFLKAGEYSHAEILSWLNKNPDAKIISDDPKRLELKFSSETDAKLISDDQKHEGLKISQVRPSMKSLCELACEKINLAVNPAELKVLYYRAPQGVN
ncbi:MAG: tRNA (adenosine(37)-N6)-threonylcarbamoyltransferase complex dimerization subunit type 1 TsaB [Synergistaceae bacterium]|nr:tRNA (adenosine(37)-N6)-threonylcarbamoyltransferase complex dimerization subunit type 1 TsaB [Synergistaceae bacterium]